MAGRTDSASRHVNASPHAVYTAMTEPDALVQWLPPIGMSATMEAFELRAGGHYRMVLRYDDADIAGKSGGNQDIVEARFVDLLPDAAVVQAVDFVSDDPQFSGTMTMSWLLAPMKGGTDVRILAQDVPNGISKADHDAGLAASLDNLAAFVERA